MVVKPYKNPPKSQKSPYTIFNTLKNKHNQKYFKKTKKSY